MPEMHDLASGKSEETAIYIANVYSSILLIFFFMFTYFLAIGNFESPSLGSRLSVMGH